MKTGRRFVYPQTSRMLLPLHIESIGFDPRQARIVRPHGYPYYHWLQVASGEGVIERDGRSETLGPNTGILLYPHVAHEYYPLSDNWETHYLTFDGTISAPLLTALGIVGTTLFHWESGTPLEHLISDMLTELGSDTDVFGLSMSSNVYRFLISLQKFGQLHKDGPISSHLSKLRPLLMWMDLNYSNPSISLGDMADMAGVATRRLITMFQSTFNMTPYSYFLQLRLSKSKQLLIAHPDKPVAQIAHEVGYRDASHFIASFRKQAGITPEQFRRLNG